MQRSAPRVLLRAQIVSCLMSSMEMDSPTVFTAMVFLIFRYMHASVIIKFLYQTLQPVCTIINYKYTQANRVEYTMTCARSEI